MSNSFSRMSRIGRRACLLAILALLSVPTILYAARNGNGNGNGYEIKLFKLLDVGGEVALRYLVDEQERGTASGSMSFTERSTWEQEISVMTKSYV